MARLTFFVAYAPTDGGLHSLLQTVSARLIKIPTSRDVLVEVMGQTYLAPDRQCLVVPHEPFHCTRMNNDIRIKSSAERCSRNR